MNSISLFLFNFVMDSLQEAALSLSSHSGVKLLRGGTVSEYADDVILLSFKVRNTFCTFEVYNDATRLRD